MRFSSAVDSLSKENSYLRMLVRLLLITLGLFSIPILFNERETVIVERSSHGLEMVHPTKFLRSDQDILRAVELMMKARFATNAISPDLFLSQRQLELRQKEQEDLKSKGLLQSVVYRSAKLSKAEGTVDFDRVLATGEIRSALKTTVKISFEETEPNELNPYGLKLWFVEVIEEKKP